LKKAKKNWFH